MFLSGCMTPLSEATNPIDQSSILGRWELSRIDRKTIDNAISLDFRANGEVRGAIECNSFLTDYEIKGQTIELGNAIVTAAGCHPRFDTDPKLVERAEATMFAEPPASISDDGQTLVLSGVSVLVFKRIRQ